MNNSAWQLAWSLFEAARALPVNEQRAFVESQNAPPEVARRVFDLLESPPEPEDAVPQLAVTHTGTRVGHYLVGELLGRGGMGEVYAARDQDLDRPVALKFLLQEEIGDPSAVKRFVREAKAASALNHPNIVTVYEILQTPSSLAIAMERVQGTPLTEFRGRANPLQQAVDLARQVAFALAAAHEGGIVHRDIKPENLMLRPDGFVKVLDFGLAHRLADPAVSAGTVTGRMLGGTLRYMSPEQLRDEPITAASDIFSLGIVLYEFAAGRHPFDSMYAWETAYAIHSKKPAAPSQANPEIPEWLDRVILSMLSQDPVSRPSARELVGRLDRAVEAARGQLFRRRRYPALAAVALLAAGVGVYEMRSKLVPPVEALQGAPVPLTGMEGLELYPAFSPDGKQIVYARDTGDGKPDLYLKLLGGGPPLRLPATQSGNLNPAWSPDGLQIAFLRRSGDVERVFVMSALGGAERFLGEITQHRSALRALTWSPDQKALTITSYIDGTTSALWSLPLDGSPRKQLTSPPAGHGDLAPAYSPEGRVLAFIRTKGSTAELFVMEKPGQERPVLTGRVVDSLAWTADGQSILFTTAAFNNRGLWRIRLRDGTPVRIAEVAGTAPFNPTVASQGRRMAFTHLTPGTSDVVELDWNGTGVPRKLIASASLNVDPAFSPDGARIAFASNRTGTDQIWSVGNDGGNPFPLTSFTEGQAGSPRWSPDGKQLAFDHNSKQGLRVVVIGAGGGSLRELVSNGIVPAWSADGRWIYFSSGRTGSWQIWRTPSGGGSQVQVTQTGGFECFPSTDGRFLYYTKDGRAGFWRTPVDGGPEVEIPELRPVVRHRYWAGTSAGIYFYDPGTEAGSASLKLYRFATGRVERVLSSVPPPMEFTHGLAVSPDAQQVLWVQFSPKTSRILLVEGFR